MCMFIPLFYRIKKIKMHRSNEARDDVNINSDFEDNHNSQDHESSIDDANLYVESSDDKLSN